MNALQDDLPTRLVRAFDARMADNQTISQLEAEGYPWMHPNVGHCLPLGREPTGAGPILRGHLGSSLGRSGEIVNLIEIV